MFWQKTGIKDSLYMYIDFHFLLAIEMSQGNTEWNKMPYVYRIEINSKLQSKIERSLTIFILYTGKQLLLQTVKTQMKCRIRRHVSLLG